MDVNKVIDVIDKITFVEENDFKISMVYFNYGEISSWYDAKTFALDCNALEYNDWRLPTIDEMKYLIRKSYMKKLFPEELDVGVGYGVMMIVETVLIIFIL